MLNHMPYSHPPSRPDTAAREELYNTLNPANQAMLDSQTGPMASRAFTTIPYTTEVTYPDHIFCILMLRRLRLPLPLTERVCRCRRNLDPLGDHRAACARAGVQRSRGVPLEHAAARVCREAGARVTMHTRLANLNIPAVQRIDDRTIEVIANGLPLWHGSQLAIDTTLVSPLTAAGKPPEGWTVCSSGTAHSTTKQTAHIPRVTGLRQVPAGGHGNGGRRPMESGIGRIPPPPGATQSPLSSCPITTSHSHLAHQPLVSHPRQRRHAPDGLANGEGVLPPLGQLVAQPEAAPTNPSRLPGRWGRATFDFPLWFVPLDFARGLCLWTSLV